MSALADEFRPTMPHDVMRAWGGDAQKELRQLQAANTELLELLRPFSDIGENRDLREAMANCLRLHERAGFLAAFAKSCAAIDKAGGAAMSSTPKQ